MNLTALLTILSTAFDLLAQVIEEGGDARAALAQLRSIREAVDLGDFSKLHSLDPSKANAELEALMRLIHEGDHRVDDALIAKHSHTGGKP